MQVKNETSSSSFIGGIRDRMLLSKIVMNQYEINTMNIQDVFETFHSMPETEGKQVLGFIEEYKFKGELIELKYLKLFNVALMYPNLINDSRCFGSDNREWVHHIIVNDLIKDAIRLQINKPFYSIDHICDKGSQAGKYRYLPALREQFKGLHVITISSPSSSPSGNPLKPLILSEFDCKEVGTGSIVDIYLEIVGSGTKVIALKVKETRNIDDGSVSGPIVKDFISF